MNQAVLYQFLPLILMFVIFYFFLIRPQKKKENEIKDMRENLKVGDKIMTIGGIIGKIVLIKEDYVVIESSSDNSKLDIMKWGISGTFNNKTELKEEN
ncbi:preprotein translocase subunit YajC [Peptoniphilus sp.]|jgi:preprotein translocase subunit YajC|uniref:preprotein translocase subunit YajC n=1 Tax=Peptoniphilus sp. TaxID=1971214 RepID=UPI003D939F15